MDFVSHRYFNNDSDMDGYFYGHSKPDDDRDSNFYSNTDLDLYLDGDSLIHRDGEPISYEHFNNDANIVLEPHNNAYFYAYARRVGNRNSDPIPDADYDVDAGFRGALKYRDPWAIRAA